MVTPETNKTLCVNYTSTKQEKQKNFDDIIEGSLNNKGNHLFHGLPC